MLGGLRVGEDELVCELGGDEDLREVEGELGGLGVGGELEEDGLQKTDEEEEEEEEDDVTETLRGLSVGGELDGLHKIEEEEEEEEDESETQSEEE